MFPRQNINRLPGSKIYQVCFLSARRFPFAKRHRPISKTRLRPCAIDGFCYNNIMDVIFESGNENDRRFALLHFRFCYNKARLWVERGEKIFMQTPLFASYDDTADVMSAQTAKMPIDESLFRVFASILLSLYAILNRTRTYLCKRILSFLL